MTYERILLKELADIQTGPFGSQLHKKDYVEVGTPIVTVEHLGNRTFTEQNLPKVSDTDKERLSKYILEKGDIVFSRVGSVDKCSFVDSKHNGWMFSGRCLRVRPRDCIYPLYLYYYFCTDETKQFIRNIAVGATMPSINTGLMGEIKVSFPPIQTQRKIAAVLSSLDDKIELNNAINRNLEQQAQALFKSWFVDFEPFGGKMPEDWKETTLDSLTSMISKGITPKYEENSNQLILNQKCIRNHFVNLSSARKHMPKKINEKWLRYGDIVINSTGTGTLGRAAQIWFNPENLTVDSHITIVRPSYPEYVFYLGIWGIKNEDVFVSMQTGSTGQSDLPRDRLKTMRVLNPDISTLNEFNNIIKPITSTIVLRQNENNHLLTLRDALLPRLMSGEIDLTNA